jgi:hypothetical protein
MIKSDQGEGCKFTDSGNRISDYVDKNGKVRNAFITEESSS